MEDSGLRNFLFIRLNSIGDIIQATPALRELKRRFPESRIIYLVSKSYKVAIKNNPYVDEVIAIPDKTYESPLGRAREYISLLKAMFILRKKDIDTALILHGTNNLFSSLGLFTKLAGIRNRIGFDSCGRNYFFTKSVPFNRNIHRTFRYLSLINFVTKCDNNDANMEFHFSKKILDTAKEALNSEGYKEDYPLITSCPSSGNLWLKMPSRDWGISNYARLYDEININYGIKVVIIGTKADVDTVNKITDKMRTKTINLVGKMSLEETAAILSISQLYIGNDSAPLFLAAAVGTPTIGIFGPTDSNLIKPFGDKHMAIQGRTKCSPCCVDLLPLYGRPTSENKIPFECQSHECMKSIKIEDVLEKLNIQLRDIN